MEIKELNTSREGTTGMPHPNASSRPLKERICSAPFINLLITKLISISVTARSESISKSWPGCLATFVVRFLLDHVSNGGDGAVIILISPTLKALQWGWEHSRCSQLCIQARTAHLDGSHTSHPSRAHPAPRAPRGRLRALSVPLRSRAGLHSRARGCHFGEEKPGMFAFPSGD